MEKDQIFILEDRGIVYICGTDAKDFLQNVITNDINKVSDTSSCFASILSPQGKYLFDFIIMKHKNGYILDCEKSRTNNLIDRLNIYKLNSKIEILNLSNEFTVAIISKEKFLTFDKAQNKEGSTIKYNGDPLILDPRSKNLGGRLISNLEKLNLSLKKLGLRSESPSKYYSLSHELGVAQIYTDKLKDKVFGIECNFEELNAIDFKKGCYVGQENTARMKLRNKIRKRLLPIKSDKELKTDGEILFNGKKVGKIIIEKPYAFALVKLFDPEFKEFSDKKLLSEKFEIKLLKPLYLKI